MEKKSTVNTFGLFKIKKNVTMKKVFLLFLLCVSIFSLKAQNAGEYDPTFGTDGKVMTAVGDNFNVANDMVIQPDGKIIVVGKAQFGSYQFAVVRYLTDGSLDNTFGENGIVITSIMNGSYAMSVALQADEKIIVSGYCFNGSAYNACVARYLDNGDLDTSFGNNGISQLTIDNTESVAIQEDGKIVVAGFSADNFALARLNSNGTIDVSFGDSGYVVTTIMDDTGNPSFSFVKDIKIQTDGKIVAAGFLYGNPNYYDIAAARYLPDGSLDPEFADGGIYKADIGGLANFSVAVVIQNDGKIILGGHNELGNIPGVPEYDANLIRLLTDGTLDPSFGDNGIGSYHLIDDAAYVEDICLQPDGKIVITGSLVSDMASTYDSYACRINSDGTIDTDFGNNGLSIINFINTEDYGQSILVQEDGNILVAGYSLSEAGFFNFTLARLLGVAQEVPVDVEVTFDNITSTTVDLTLTPSSSCASYYFVIMTYAEMQQWLPVMGSAETIIKQWGIQKEETYSHHFSDLTPDTEYLVYTLCLDQQGNELPYDSIACTTLAAGGPGEALATISLSEITYTSVRMIVTPNSETAVFHDGLITKSYFDEIGQDAAVELIKENNYPLYITDDWVWLDLESNTTYKAIAVCKNGNGEWGTPTIQEFNTLGVSVNETDNNNLLIFPNPNNGIFQLIGDNMQGANIKVFDMSGKLIFTQMLNSFVNQVDASLIQSGLYLIEIEKDGCRTFSRFIKK